MKYNPCFHAVTRNAVRTLTLIIIITLTSFAFLSRAVEGLIVNGQVNRLKGYYRAIGSLAAYGAATSINGGALEVIARDERVKFTDTRVSLAGVLDGVYNADQDMHGPLGKVYFYGTLVEKSGGVFIDETLQVEDQWHPYLFRFKVEKIVASMPGNIREGDTVTMSVMFPPYSKDPPEVLFDSAEVGARYLMRGEYNPRPARIDADGNVVSDGDDYRFEVGVWQGLNVRPLTDNEPFFREVEPGTEYHTDILDDDVDMFIENMHTMNLVTTKDMTAIPGIQKTVRVKSGRMLNEEDHLNGNKVCLVSAGFASLRGFGVGDTITVNMRKTNGSVITINSYFVNEYDYNYGLPEGYKVEFGAWRNCDYVPVTLEIVGVYGVLGGYYDANQIYVPESAAPSDWLPLMTYNNTSTYSFVLKSPDGRAAFALANADALSDLGYTLKFEDDGYQTFVTSSNSILTSIVIGGLAFGVVMLLAIYLAVFLYFSQRRKEYAIMRALGVPKRRASRNAIAPLFMIAAVSVAAGGVAAWFFALTQVQGMLKHLKGAEFAAPSILWLLLMLALVFAVAAAFAYVQSRSLGRLSVLELLQGAGKQKRVRKKSSKAAKQRDEAARDNTGKTVAARPRPAATEPIVLPKLEYNGRRKPASAHVLRYIAGHVSRTPGKAVLTAMVAAVFVAALGWISASIVRNTDKLNEVYASTVVKGSVINSDGYAYAGLESVAAYFIVNSGMVSHYEMSFSRWVFTVKETKNINIVTLSNIIPDSVLVTDRPWVFDAESPAYLDVEYADGYGADDILFGGSTQNILMSKSLLEKKGLELGGDAAVYDFQYRFDKDGWLIYKTFRIIGVFEPAGELGDKYADLDMVMPRGCVSSVRDSYDWFYGLEFTFDPAMNWNIPEFYEKAMAKMHSRWMDPNTMLLLQDDELRSVAEPLEKNINLMKILYPIVMAVSALIAAGLTALIVMLSVKEAAIMRTLGTTRRRSLIIMSLEQTFLCVLGLAIGLGVSPLLGGVSLAAAGVYLAGCAVAAAVCAWIVVNRKPLEMLQVKE